MANEVKNSDSFERILDDLAQGFGTSERLAANTAGADVFVSIMKPKVPKRSGVDEKIHLRDALIKVPHANGSVDVGFSSKSDKGYIGRFQNDGWTVKDKTGKIHSHVPGKHFWEETQNEAKGKVGQAVAEVLKAEMNKKVRGG
ncbi:phage tail protein [Liquorilactobacillus mali]|uniref:phage tail protein n=1 Tax=Liquorilactobacillus mali TaxID=1618 RepID=UPI00264C7FED|nr:phage tail protein [Liquorilactobacillus mali]MDN7145268.1 phage tail protein [Liquorilactobacillus mali]